MWVTRGLGGGRCLQVWLEQSKSEAWSCQKYQVFSVSTVVLPYDKSSMRTMRLLNGLTLFSKYINGPYG